MIGASVGKVGTVGGGGRLAPPIAPVNLTAPTISGSVFPGQVLTSTDGTWAGSPVPTLSRQWQRNGVDISGATASTYTVSLSDEGQYISFRVVASNSAGSASATSSALRHAAATDLGPYLRQWLDGRDPSTIVSGTGVAQWSDRSGLNNHSVQALGASQPSYGSFRVTFDGVDDHLIGTQVLSVDHTIFLAYQNRTVNTDINASILSQDGGSNPDFWITARSSGATNVQGLNTVAGTNSSTSVTAPKNADLTATYLLPSTQGGGVTSVNGTESTNAAAANDPSQLGNRLVIGTQKLTPARYFAGDVLESIVTNTRLSATVRAKMEARLAHRHGTLASFNSGSPYKTTPPPAVLRAEILPGMIAAYSINRVNAQYTGPCMRVRRDDGTTLDIGFTSFDVFDFAALAAFCGNQSGWCVTWYDQIGTRHLTNATGSTQFNVFFLGSNWGGLQGASGITRFLQTTNDAVFNFASKPMTLYMAANTANIGGTSFGRMISFGSGGGARIMMATASSTGVTPRQLVQRPAGGVEWYSTPTKDVANGESIIVTDKTSVADINAMRSWINGGSALAWGPSRAITAMDGSFVLGAASNDTGTGFIYKELLVCDQQHSDDVRNWTTARLASAYGASIT